jgi:hypothetical protein
MSEPENLVLAHLRELRADMEAQFEALKGEMGARFDKIERRLEIMHSNGEKALRQFIGHRAMVERNFAPLSAA